MAENLTATFSLVDQISSRLDAIATAGLNMIDRLERAAEVADSLFDTLDSGGVTAARSVDGVATSCQSMGAAWRPWQTSPTQQNKLCRNMNRPLPPGAAALTNGSGRQGQPQTLQQSLRLPAAAPQTQRMNYPTLRQTQRVKLKTARKRVSQRYNCCQTHSRRRAYQKPSLR